MRKIFKVWVPLSVVLTVLSIYFIILLIQVMRRPFLISPVVLPFYTDSGNEDKYFTELEKILHEYGILYSSLDKLNNSILIKLSNSGEVVISSQKDPRIEISSLQYILSRLTMEGKDFTRLDLRFDKPVIVLR